MASSNFSFLQSSLILIFTVAAGLSNLSSQDYLPFEENVLSINPYELYQEISESNTGRDIGVKNFSDFAYDIDSIYRLQEPLEFFDEDIVRQSSVYRFQEIDSNCVIREIYSSFCVGFGCSIEPDLVFSFKRNDKNQLLGLQVDLWDGEEFIHEFELPFEEQYFYENCLLVSRRTISTIDSFIYDDNGLLSRMYNLNNFENEDSFEIVEKYLYNHNEEGLLESIVHLDFVNAFNEIIVVDSTHYEYDTLGRMIEEERHLSNFDTIPVRRQLRSVFSYNYEVDILTKREKRFSPTIDLDTIWGVEERTLYSYNEDGSLDNYSIRDIRGGGESPIFFMKFEYDMSIRNKDVFFLANREDTYAISRENGVLDNFGYPFKRVSGDISPGYRMYYYKPTNTVSTSNVQKLEVRRDMNIDISNLPSGTYHYSISSGQKVGSGTFVKM